MYKYEFEIKWSGIIEEWIPPKWFIAYINEQHTARKISREIEKELDEKTIIYLGGLFNV